MDIQVLSTEDVFERERPEHEGGDLAEGNVVVCDVQPLPSFENVGQIRRNLECGVSYLYFLTLTPSTVEKICQGLHLAMVAGEADLSARQDMIVKSSDRVLGFLENLCSTGSLRFSFISHETPFCFRIHNASCPERARLYLRIESNHYLLFKTGQDAIMVWDALPRWLSDDVRDRLFVPLKQNMFSEQEQVQFEASLDRALRRYFPGIEDKVKRLCIGSGYTAIA